MVDPEQVLDEVERPVVGPVQVVEHQYDGQGGALRHPPQPLRCSVEATRANLRRVLQDAAHVRTGGEVEPDQVGQHVGL